MRVIQVLGSRDVISWNHQPGRMMDGWVAQECFFANPRARSDLARHAQFVAQLNNVKPEQHGWELYVYAERMAYWAGALTGGNGEIGKLVYRPPSGWLSVCTVYVEKDSRTFCWTGTVIQKLDTL